MRQRGVPDFQDPSNPGGFSARALAPLDVTSPKFISANSTCQRSLPNDGQATPAELEQTIKNGLNFARCMPQARRQVCRSPHIWHALDHRPWRTQHELTAVPHRRSHLRDDARLLTAGAAIGAEDKPPAQRLGSAVRTGLTYPRAAARVSALVAVRSARIAAVTRSATTAGVVASSFPSRYKNANP